MYMCAYMHIHATGHMCGSEGNLRKLVLSLYHVGPGDGIQIVVLGVSLTISLTPGHCV